MHAGMSERVEQSKFAVLRLGSQKSEVGDVAAAEEQRRPIARVPVKWTRKSRAPAALTGVPSATAATSLLEAASPR